MLARRALTSDGATTAHGGSCFNNLEISLKLDSPNFSQSIVIDIFIYYLLKIFRQWLIYTYIDILNKAITSTFQVL